MPPAALLSWVLLGAGLKAALTLSLYMAARRRTSSTHSQEEDTYVNDETEEQEPIMVRIPRGFYDIAREQDVTLPEIVKATKYHYTIDADDEEVENLVNYARTFVRGEDVEATPGQRSSARATLKSILAERDDLEEQDQSQDQS